MSTNAVSFNKGTTLTKNMGFNQNTNFAENVFLRSALAGDAFSGDALGERGSFDNRAIDTESVDFRKDTGLGGSASFAKYLLAILVAIAGFGLLFPNPQFAYHDISGHWGEARIRKATEYGLFQGYETGNFLPDKRISRAEFLTVMSRALEVSPAEDSSPYWAVKYVKALKSGEFLAADYDESKDYLEDEMSRLEMMRLLLYIIEKLNLPLDTPVPDMADISTLNEEDILVIQKVLSSGVIQGTSKTTVSPYAMMTRAQLATIFVRIYEKADRSPQSVVAVDKIVSASLDSGYALGDVFSPDTPVAESRKINSALTWIIPDSSSARFVIVNRDNIVVGTSISELPTKNVISKIKYDYYYEYTYSDSCVLDYREWDGRVGADSSLVMIRIDPNYKKQFDTLPVDAEEIEGYEKVTDYLINLFRIAKKKPIFAFDEQAYRSSKSFSETMAKRNFFDHDIPGGKSYAERMRTSGIDYRIVGENIAYTFADPITLAMMWINSPAHRQNLLRDFTRSAVGISAVRGGILATQTLFTPQK